MKRKEGFFCGKIRYMKTFWSRWWICNKFRKLCKIKGGFVWLEEEEFISYIRQLVTKDKSKDGVTKLIRFPYNYFGEIKNDLILQSKIRNLIEECSDKLDGVGYMMKVELPKESKIMRIRLTARGQEISGTSYPIFGSEFGKNTCTAVIAGVLIWFFTARLVGIFNIASEDRVQQYPQSQPQIIYVGYPSSNTIEKYPVINK
jgi:hypothetical protein